jgi:hypothetical protein
LPSRARVRRGGGGAAAVSEKLLVDGIAEAVFEGAERLEPGFAFLDLAVVVGAAVAAL